MKKPYILKTKKLRITKLVFSSYNFYKTRNGFVAHFWKFGIYYGYFGN